MGHHDAVYSLCGSVHVSHWCNKRSYGKWSLSRITSRSPSWWRCRSRSSDLWTSLLARGRAQTTHRISSCSCRRSMRQRSRTSRSPRCALLQLRCCLTLRLRSARSRSSRCALLQLRCGLALRLRSARSRSRLFRLFVTYSLPRRLLPHTIPCRSMGSSRRRPRRRSLPSRCFMLHLHHHHHHCRGVCVRAPPLSR